MDKHGCEHCGHFEDLVVDADFRRMRLGRYLCLYFRKMAYLLGLHRIVLECRDELLGWYESFGYKRAANLMTYKFDM